MHHKIKKILLVLVVAVASLASASIPIITANAEAFNQQQFNDMKEKIDDAAKARHATRVMHLCAATDDWWDSSMLTGTYSYNQAFNGQTDLPGGLGMFLAVNPANIDIIGSIGTGRWLESQVQDKYDNGNIDCGDSGDGMLDHIVDVTAETLGTDRAGILCDGEISGLLKNTEGQPCGSDQGKYVRSDGWESHLKTLYEARMDDLFGDDEELKSMFSWDTAVSDNYDGIAGYSLYVTEIKEANCGGEVSDLSHSHIETPLKNVDNYGNIVDIYYAGDDGNGSQIVSKDGFVTKGNNGTCGDYIGFANEHFPAFQQLVLRKIKEGCYDARKEQVEDIQGKLDSLGEGDRETVEAGLNTALGLISEYEKGNMDALVETYVDDEGNASTTGGLMCKKIEGLPDIDMEDYTSLEEASETTTDKPTCYSSGGAKSLGWIVCPLLEWMSDAANYLYETFIEPSLNVQPYLFGGSGESATWDAWNTFRNIANICFIIIALIVIFSQITGVGINNYGIKKILPKLIVVAILVNLSYIICQVCVDLSNILGNALQAMFDGLATGAPPAPEVASLGDQFTSTITSAILIAPAIFALGAAIWQNPAIVLSFFIALLGVVISVLFLFILLAARQAAIVVLIVLSPLVAICYALPNTKSLSDKWIKLFQGLLMVYPIAGLLVGGGNFVSRLLQQTGFAGDGVFTAITAMVVGIIPIFAIPSALKASFAAMGSLGAKISGMGSQLSRAATHGARHSDFYNNAQQRSLQRKRRIESGFDKNYEPKKNNIRSRFANTRVGRAIGYNDALNQKRGMALKDYESRGSSNLSNDGAARQALYSKQMKMFTEENAGRTWGDMDQELQQAVANFNENPEDTTASARLAAAIQTANERGMNKELMKVNNNGLGLTTLALDGSNKNHSAILNQMAASKNVALSEYAKSRQAQGTAKSFDDYINSAGEDSLQAGLAKHGEDALVGMDADTLNHINNVSSQQGSFGGATTEMMVKAATQTKDTRQLEALNNLLSRKGDSDGYRINVNDLGKLKLDTLQSLDANIYENAARTLFDGSSSSQKVLNGMDEQSISYIRRSLNL